MLSENLTAIARALNAEKIKYMVIGGQAVLLYGEPRLTWDIDINLKMSIKELPRLMKILKKAGIKILTAHPENFVKKTMVLPAVFEARKVRLNLIFADSEYENQALKRARKIKIKRTTVSFASPEDIVIQKVFAGRPRDIEDARNIVVKNKKLEVDYIKAWLSEFDRALSQDNLKVFKALLGKK
jgi:hypothetical protein